MILYRVPAVATLTSSICCAAGIQVAPLASRLDQALALESEHLKQRQLSYFLCAGTLVGPEHDPCMEPHVRP